MKVIKYQSNKTKATWYVREELIKEGKMILLDSSMSNEPEYHKTYRREFKDLNLYQSGYNEMENFLCYLKNEVKLEEGDNGFSMPLPDSTTEYFILFDDKIWLYFYFTDEYIGMGDSEQYVKIDSILVPEGTPIEEVKEVKEWLIKGGFKLLRD